MVNQYTVNRSRNMTSHQNSTSIVPKPVSLTITDTLQRWKETLFLETMVTNGKGGFSVGSGGLLHLQRKATGDSNCSVYTFKCATSTVKQTDQAQWVLLLLCPCGPVPTCSSPRPAPHTLPLIVFVSITTAVIKHHHQKQLGQESCSQFQITLHHQK